MLVPFSRIRASFGKTMVDLFGSSESCQERTKRTEKLEYIRISFILHFFWRRRRRRRRESTRTPTSGVARVVVEHGLGVQTSLHGYGSTPTPTLPEGCTRSGRVLSEGGEVNYFLSFHDQIRWTRTRR